VNVSIGDSLRAFAAYGRYNAPTPAAIGRQHTVVAGEIDPLFWHESRQSRNEIYWVDFNVNFKTPSVD
jgi:hypothetical protein